MHTEFVFIQMKGMLTNILPRLSHTCISSHNLLAFICPVV